MPFATATDLGIRHTQSWLDSQVPTHLRHGMKFLFPNDRRMPLTILLSSKKAKKPSQPKFGEFTKNHPLQAGAITGLYTDAGITTAYTDAVSPIGTIVYAKVAEALAKEFTPGHTVLLQTINDNAQEVFGAVEQVLLSGANSRVGVRLLEATTASEATGKCITNANYITISGSAYHEGAPVGESVNYTPTEMYNYTQIFRTPFSITETMNVTELLTGDAMTEEQREKFALHGQQMERAFMFGRRYIETVGGKPKRYTMGLIPMINEYAPQNVFNYVTDTDNFFKGKDFEVAGKEWLENKLEYINRFGNLRKLCICGSGFILGLNRLAEAYGGHQLVPRQTEFGISIMDWITPFGELALRESAQLTLNPAYTNSGILLELDNIEENTLRPTKKILVKGEDSESLVDARIGEYKTETGLFYQYPATFGMLHGVGLANTVS